ncbi:MAG: glycosyltransferase family 2 protein [bacterium]|nr:glycosyltransferase family 2 protein [bacterium]
MLLSIVTGTYNRLEYLKAFMESCEQSILPYIEHEYCICDGGSLDGTLEWLKGEASEKYNITLIEHGELKGAIKAFNDAAAAAKGDYLLIGNDDVIVQEDSITRALGELLSDPTLGAACFFQDRAGRDWHVETMEITLPDGRGIVGPYLQVGIIPKFLWDYAGGWGDFGSNTYGGDNWVSAKVYEAGYKIKAIEGAKIHDRTPIDELRKINNDMNRGGADGKKFYAAFPDGITYNDEPQFPNPIHGKYKKILYAPIYEPGNEVQKQQKRGLRDALAKHGIVYEVDYLAGKSIALAAGAWLPDLTVTQLHSADKAMVEQIKEVRKHTRESMVNWCGDTYTDQNSTPEFIECMRYFDLHTSVNNTLKDFFKKNGVNYHYWQIAFERNVLPSELR